MQILHVIPSYYPAFEFGGPTQSVHFLNAALVKKGIEVKVLTTNIGLENVNSLELDKWVDVDGVKVKYFPFYLKQLGRNFTFSPSLFFALFQEVKECDLVHITGIWNFPILAGSISSLLHKKPYIISPRGCLYEDAINIKSSTLKKLYYFLIVRNCLCNASVVHLTAEDEKDKLASFIKLDTKTFIIPNGLDLTKFENLPLRGNFKENYPVLSNKRYILFLGRITPKKGINILIDAFARISTEYENIFLVIVGPDENNYSFKLKKQIENYGLTSRVIFTGMLTGQDKLSAYVDASIFALPSYFENFGMAVVEAMACETPVIISNRVGIYKEIESYKAGIVVDLNVDSLANKIKELIENPNLSREISTNGKKLVREKYDIDKVADMMISVYKKLIESNK